MLGNNLSFFSILRVENEFVYLADEFEVILFLRMYKSREPEVAMDANGAVCLANLAGGSPATGMMMMMIEQTVKSASTMNTMNKQPGSLQY